ncbi:MAG: cupin domain-containing protein [Gammaproteobacteria bacterium]
MSARRLLIASSFLALASGVWAESAPTVPKPALMNRADLAGVMLEGPGVLRSEHEGNTTLDITSLKASDGRFASGMYRSGKVRSVIDKPYGVDEFMYFLEGGVTLTSADGSVIKVGAGEAVTIPKEWTGVWDTEGYTKIWVIYSADGSGL